MRTLTVSLVATTLLACGGAVSGSANDAGVSPESSANTPDSGIPWSMYCPPEVPSTGSSCTGRPVQCEYGNAWWNPACDTVVECMGGAWTAVNPYGAPCTPQPAPNSPACPADYGTIQNEGSCPMQGLDCFYDHGVSCLCSASTLPGSDGGAPKWDCNPRYTCPKTRPLLGSACSGTAQCNYGEGGGCGYIQACDNGVWQGATITGCGQ